jgi:hypothetical protein
MATYRTNDPAGSATQLATKTVAGASPGGLFPFASLNPTSYTNNYQLWAGTCRQEQPPAGIDAATVTPGLLINPMAVTAPAVDINATYKQQNGTVIQVAPSDVKFTFTSDANSGQNCSDIWGPFNTASAKQVATTPITYRYAAPFASSATSGSGASASGQTGTVTVCADYTPGGGKYYKANGSSSFTDSFSSPTALTTIPILWANAAPGQC